MKITETAASMPNITGILGKEDKKTSDVKGNEFKKHLRVIGSQNVEERLRELADRIIQQGDKLAKKIDIAELKTYRKLLSEFLNEAVGNSHKFSRENFLDRRGRHRVYALVRKINVEVEQLAKDVLEQEKDHIKILKRIDDIKGLILDILM